MISLTSKYSIRTMIELAAQDCEDFVRAKDLAVAVRVPGPYLAKIIKGLVKKGYLVGRKGPGGGIKISKRGRAASFYDICVAVNDPLMSQACFLSRKACSGDSPCPMHDHWAKVRGQMFKFLNQSKIANYGKY